MRDCHPAPTPQVTGQAPPKSSADEDVKSVPYQSLVGALQYLATATRPDIAHAVRFLASHTHDYTATHWHLAKRRQVPQGHSRRRRSFGGPDATLDPTAYSDADFATDAADSKSITGSVLFLYGGPVAYASKKQSLVGQSTTEVEFIAAAETSKTVIWLRELLSELGVAPSSPTILHVDNQSAIQVAKRTSAHGRTKHIHLRFHVFQELVEEGTLALVYVNTHNQVADIMTKPLAERQLTTLRARLGMAPPLAASHDVSDENP